MEYQCSCCGGCLTQVDVIKCRLRQKLEQKMIAKEEEERKKKKAIANLKKKQRKRLKLMDEAMIRRFEKRLLEVKIPAEKMKLPPEQIKKIRRFCIYAWANL